MKHINTMRKSESRTS